MNGTEDAREKAQGRVSEEELRAQIEQEMRRARVEDLLAQSVAAIVNLSARRIGKEDERDLEQARVGIEAVRALVDLLPKDAQPQVREALSQLQILYARAAEGESEPGGAPAGAADREEGQEAPQQPRGKGPEPPPRLWTPPGAR